MITESATIIEIEPDRVRVEVRSSSGCSSCSAKAGCGNGILDRWLNPTRILWVASDRQFSTSAELGDNIHIGVEEGAFVKNALLLYMLPILAFLLGAGLGHQFQGDLAAVLGGVFGLLVGASLVRYLVRHSSYASEFTPQIISENPAR